MKKKNAKNCFSGGELTALIPYVEGMIGDYTSAATYEFNPGQPAPKVDWSQLPTKGILGMLPQILMSQKDKKQRAAYTPSATPGNYYQGGPLTGPIAPKAPVAIPTDAMFNPYANVLQALVRLQNDTGVVTALGNPNGVHSSKSKSRDRLRERATGGKLDQQLSDSSFQVKGNPNVTDGNYYPQYNANLDYNEVVKDTFVFSNKLKSSTGKSFAEEARKLEIAVGKAEKMLKNNPNDSFARNTITNSEGRSALLAKEQETLATLKGLRGPSKGYAMGGYTGGPDDPIYSFLGETSPGLINDPLGLSNISSSTWLNLTNPLDPATGKRRRPIGPDTFIGRQMESGQTAIDLGRSGLFYDPYGKNFAVRNSKGEYVAVKPNSGQFAMNGPIIKDLVTGKSYNVDEHLRYMSSPRMDTAGPTGPRLETPANILYNNDSPTGNPTLGAFPYPVNSTQTLPPPATAPSPIATTPLSTRSNGKKQPPVPNSWQALAQAVNKLPKPIPSEIPSDAEVLAQLGTAPDRHKPEDRLANLGPLTSPAEDAKTMNMDAVATTPSPDNILGSLYKGFTLGDALQAVEVGSKFAQTFGGPEKQKAYYDTTNITKENYDPANALYQSQRNFELAKNSLQNASINQNRSFTNNLYANKLNQDSDIVSKYNQMNQSARTQQEQRQSDQRRYNIGVAYQTDDINARNRGAYKNALDTAFTSLGNFGENLNQRKQSYDALNILRASYPEVYARIMKGIYNAG